jgi:hypothetical protein
LHQGGGKDINDEIGKFKCRGLSIIPSLQGRAFETLLSIIPSLEGRAFETFLKWRVCPTTFLNVKVGLFLSTYLKS